jgi:uncharacterized membrane protein YhaH (DUF805 family)
MTSPALRCLRTASRSAAPAPRMLCAAPCTAQPRMTAPTEHPETPPRSDCAARGDALMRSEPAAAAAQPPVLRPDIPAPTEPAPIFLSFQGRISRRTWWLYGVAALLGLGVLLTVLLRVAGADENTAAVLVTLLLLWPSLAVSVKRWHDRDKSGWWVLVGLIPIVGPLWLLVANGLLRGTSGPNRYGADPLAQQP